MPKLPLHAGLLLVAALACGGGDRAADADAPPAAGVVDSALPIPELLARFRASTPDTLTALSGGADSPDALGRALLAAVRRRDTAAVRALAVSRAEFAWLYYPHTRFTAPPYELGPDLVWLQLVAASDKGAGRLLERYGGRTLRFERVVCPDTAALEGPNRVTTGCTVRFAVADSAARDLRLFATTLARDGRVKVLSFANDL